MVQALARRGPTHPTDLVEHFGNQSVKNAWGGNSRATKCALERAHHYGYLRVIRRDSGLRIYEAVQDRPERLEPEERCEKLLLLTANLFGPTSERFLLSQLGQHRHLAAVTAHRKSVLKRLLKRGQLQSQPPPRPQACRPFRRAVGRAPWAGPEGSPHLARAREDK